MLSFTAVERDAAEQSLYSTIQNICNVHNVGRIGGTGSHWFLFYCGTVA